MSPAATVVCVHGFWSHGVGMYLVKRRLEREYGLRVLLFNYPSVRGTLDENAALLEQFIADQALDQAHFIGHSLGGVVALRMWANAAAAPPGRLVCLGSPLSGSRAAEFLSRQDWAELVLGRSLAASIADGGANVWGSHVCESRDVGIIAGTVPLGFGQFVAGFDEPNDGTIAVAETLLEGAADHLVMKVSHQGMLLSHDVIDQAAAFLKSGEFLRDDSDDR